MQYRLEHLGLAARDTVALQQWYRRVLGAKLVFDNGKSPPAFFLEMPGGLLVEIYEGDFALEQISDNGLHGWRHLALRIESIETAKQELTELGVAFTEPIKPAGGGGRVLFFQDREGNLLHLVERPAESVFQRQADR